MSTRIFSEPNRARSFVRPAHINLDLPGNFNFIDQSGGINWTVGGTQLTLRQFVAPGFGKFMDDDDEISIVSGRVSVPEGLWYARFAPRVTKGTSATQEDYHMAITNGAGTTIYRAVGPIAAQVLVPNSTRQIIEAFIDIPAAGGEIAFRAAQSTAGTDFSILVGQVVGFVTRVIPAGKLDKE